MNLQIMNVTKEFKDKKAVDKVNLTLTPGDGDCSGPMELEKRL